MEKWIVDGGVEENRHAILTPPDPFQIANDYEERGEEGALF